MAGSPRYRIVVYELDTETEVETLINDFEGEAFHVAVGSHSGEGRMSGEHGVGGPVHLLEHLAELVADRPTGSTR